MTDRHIDTTVFGPQPNNFAPLNDTLSAIRGEHPVPGSDPQPPPAPPALAPPGRIDPARPATRTRRRTRLLGAFRKTRP